MLSFLAVEISGEAKVRGGGDGELEMLTPIFPCFVGLRKQPADSIQPRSRDIRGEQGAICAARKVSEENTLSVQR